MNIISDDLFVSCYQWLIFFLCLYTLFFKQCSCGRKQTGGYLEGAAPDGVMGLGPGEISVPSVLAKAGMIQNSFSLCFDANGSGRILFGDQGHLAQQSTPFLPMEEQ